MLETKCVGDKFEMLVTDSGYCGMIVLKNIRRIFKLLLLVSSKSKFYVDFESAIFIAAGRRKVTTKV